MLFIRSFTTSSARFSEFDDGNMILFQIKFFGRNIKETALARCFIKVMHLILIWTSLQILAKKFSTYYIFRYTLTPISVRYYWNVTGWNGSLWTHSRKYSINQTKWLFFDIYPASILFKKESTKVQLSDLQHLRVSSERDIMLQRSNIFGQQFYTKKFEKAQIACIPSFLCSKTYGIIVWPEVDRIHKNFCICSSCVSIGIRKKFKISCEFGPLQVKLWYHMFSSMKIE